MVVKLSNAMKKTWNQELVRILKIVGNKVFRLLVLLVLLVSLMFLTVDVLGQKVDVLEVIVLGVDVLEVNDLEVDQMGSPGLNQSCYRTAKRFILGVLQLHQSHQKIQLQ